MNIICCYVILANFNSFFILKYIHIYIYSNYWWFLCYIIKICGFSLHRSCCVMLYFCMKTFFILLCRPINYVVTFERLWSAGIQLRVWKACFIFELRNLSIALFNWFFLSSPISRSTDIFIRCLCADLKLNFCMLAGF